MDNNDEFKRRICNEAETLVKDFLPRKITEYDSLLQENDFNLVNIFEVKSSTIESLKDLDQSKENTLESGETNSSSKPERVFATNEYITRLVDRLKPEIITLLEAVGTLRMWVILLIPKIEDGNNFGVEVQEETLGELKTVEQELASNQEQIAGYFLSRAKVISQLCKRPGVQDYKRFVEEEDEKQFVSMRLMVAELRNACSSLHDLINKNIDKIKTPRNRNTMSSIY
ncbi:proteasome activator complex subunit 3-like [Ciona intestinalis]|nr:proteasome activator complex subunit 3-like [Ciona intestinalis]|eukprot:XP_002121893.1 proteasome activator complex subunit 3-like [Ciona intestinalis]